MHCDVLTEAVPSRHGGASALRAQLVERTGTSQNRQPPIQSKPQHASASQHVDSQATPQSRAHLNALAEALHSGACDAAALHAQLAERLQAAEARGVAAELPLLVFPTACAPHEPLRACTNVTNFYFLLLKMKLRGNMQMFLRNLLMN